MAVSPSYTPVNAINWELRDLSHHDVWSKNEISSPTKRAYDADLPMDRQITQCREEVKKIAERVGAGRKERASMKEALAEAERKAVEARRRIEELEALVAQAWQQRGTPGPSITVAKPQTWEKEKEELFIQLGDLKREKAREAEEYTHIQSRLEAKTDELHRQAAQQAEEIQRLREQVEQATQRESLHTKRIENMQRIQRKATRDRNDVLETLEAGLDEARNEAAACKRQMEDVLNETQQQISAAEVRGREAQLKELRALSPRAMLSFLTYPQQSRPSGVWGWLGSA